MRNWQAQPRGGARIGKRANYVIFLRLTNQQLIQVLVYKAQDVKHDRHLKEPSSMKMVTA